ncbi:MAG: ornithine carbamoyltransferase [Elusimicrobia bacterium]|nr:ornithine carbamoyltransferase [Elusimicrobiota bacterium]
MPKKRKDLITLADVRAQEIYGWFELARKLKKQTRSGKTQTHLRGKILAMIFQKPSTRTRVSFEVGMRQLGGHALYLASSELQIGRGETVADTARVLSRYVQGILARVFAHSDIEELSRWASVPVLNGLSDLTHPCQALADYFTLLEKKGKLKGLKIAYLGDGNNVAHSLLLGGAKLGVSVTCITPAGYEPKPNVLRQAIEEGKSTGASFEVTSEIARGVRGADALYTDVWASMGQEAERDARLQIFRPYQLNEDVLAATGKKDTLVLHCLPAHRGEEITDGVMDSAHSVVFEEAENRLHVQKALLVSLMG